MIDVHLSRFRCTIAGGKPRDRNALRGRDDGRQAARAVAVGFGKFAELTCGPPAPSQFAIFAGSDQGKPVPTKGANLPLYRPLVLRPRSANLQTFYSATARTLSVAPQAAATWPGASPRAAWCGAGCIATTGRPRRGRQTPGRGSAAGRGGNLSWPFRPPCGRGRLQPEFNQAPCGFGPRRQIGLLPPPVINLITQISR